MKLLPLALLPLLVPAVALAADPPPAAPTSAPSAAPAPAAAPAPPPRAWHIDLSGGTQFPTSIGAITTAELPYRILLQLDLGWMPTPYAYAIDAFLKAIGSYDATVSQLIRTALGNSFVLRASAGWRPFEKHGFEFLGGYTLVTLGGSLAGREVVQALLMESGSMTRLPDDTARELPMRMTMHSFQIQVGWRWLFLDDRMVLRASLSYLQCVAARSSVELQSRRPGAAMTEAKINQEIDDYLSPYLTTYVKTPVVGLSLGYRF